MWESSDEEKDDKDSEVEDITSEEDEGDEDDDTDPGSGSSSGNEDDDSEPKDKSPSDIELEQGTSRSSDRNDNNQAQDVPQPRSQLQAAHQKVNFFSKESSYSLLRKGNLRALPGSMEDLRRWKMDSWIDPKFTVLIVVWSSSTTGHHPSSPTTWNVYTRIN